MIRVMSFNIRYGTAEDGENSWVYRKKLVIDRIRAFDPDLLGIQECRDDEQAEYLRSQLADYEFFGVRRGGQGEPSHEMAPILYRRAAFEELERGHFWLSETPSIPGSASWGSTFPRTVLWVLLRQKEAAGQVFLFFNTHLDYVSGAIYKAANLLLTHIEGLIRNGPLILCGDFNVNKDTPAYQILIDAATAEQGLLHDTYREVNTNQTREGTYHDYGRRKDPLAIDWILASGHFTTTEAGVDRYSSGGRYPSDHYPVHARVRFSEG